MGRKDKVTMTGDTENLPIGQKMRLSRQEKDIPLTRMAARIGYSKSYLSGVENGKLQPPREMVESYEKILELEHGELVTALQFQQPSLQVISEHAPHRQHIELLEQGVEEWNHWREENPEIRSSLSRVKLHGAKLRGVNLNGADLTRIELNEVDLSEADLGEAILRQAQLRHVDLIKANLSRAFLSGAEFLNVDLSGANLSEADLSGANLSKATLKNADLSGTNLSRVDLSMADLEGADLSKANLSGANLSGANLSRVTTASTIFGDVDLRQVRGMETVRYLGPSTIGIDTINRSNGEIPEVFLRGTGLSDVHIEFVRSLRARSIEYYTCFISYSSKDQVFAQRLYADLTSKGIRCWFAPEDLKIGDRIRPLIDETIKQYDKLIIILSEHSITSSWIEEEVEVAFEKERLKNQPALFPIRLDDMVMRTSQAWAADIRRTRNIGDFTKWKDRDSYQQAFRRLLRDLHAESRSSGSTQMAFLAEEAVARWVEMMRPPGSQVNRRTGPGSGLDMYFVDNKGETVGVEVKYSTRPREVRSVIFPIINRYLKDEIRPPIDKLILVCAFPEESAAHVADSILPKMDNVPPTVSFVTGYIQNGEFRESVDSVAE